MLRKCLPYLLVAGSIFTSSVALAETYVIDKSGMHAGINFKIKHLGYSWLTGRFNDLEGTFTYDVNKPEATVINVKIDPVSIDSNHELRDKHLRGSDFLNVKKYKTSSFKSTKVTKKADGTFTIAGDFTLHGQTRQIVIDAEEIGGGKDPWGGFRRGFSGTTSLKLTDFGLNYDLGKASQVVYLEIHIEGIRQ